MPNHVLHKFTVTGDEATIQRFKSTCFTPRDNIFEFDFNALVPRPVILDQTISGNMPEMQTDRYKAIQAQAIAETGSHDWYEWSLKNWGTKWNAYNTIIIDDTDDYLRFDFDTAWSCPEPIFKAIGAQYPELVMHGEALDEGSGFCADILISEFVWVEYSEPDEAYIDAFHER